MKLPCNYLSLFYQRYWNTQQRIAKTFTRPSGHVRGCVTGSISDRSQSTVDNQERTRHKLFTLRTAIIDHPQRWLAPQDGMAMWEAANGRGAGRNRYIIIYTVCNYSTAKTSTTKKTGYGIINKKYAFKSWSCPLSTHLRNTWFATTWLRIILEATESLELWITHTTSYLLQFLSYFTLPDSFIRWHSEQEARVNEYDVKIIQKLLAASTNQTEVATVSLVEWLYRKRILYNWWSLVVPGSLKKGWYCSKKICIPCSLRTTAREGQKEWTCPRMNIPLFSSFWPRFWLQCESLCPTPWGKKGIFHIGNNGAMDRLFWESTNSQWFSTRISLNIVLNKWSTSTNTKKYL